MSELRESAQISDGHARDVCRPGSGAATCAFLTFGGGWVCAKTDPGIASMILVRLADGSMNAKGDNCTGPPDFEVAV